LLFECIKECGATNERVIAMESEQGLSAKNLQDKQIQNYGPATWRAESISFEGNEKRYSKIAGALLLSERVRIPIAKAFYPPKNYWG
jgi:hypothetical protein